MNAKPSKAPLFLGGCGCASMLLGLVLLGIGAGMGGLHLPAGWTETVHYTNTREGRTGDLADAYTGFELDYPKTWMRKADDPSNFVAVEHQADGKTLENLTVGYFKTAGSREGNEALYGQLIAQLQNQFSQQFANLQKVSEGPMNVGDYAGYQGLFSARVEADGKPVDVYTRAILLPTPDHTKGVTLLLMGTSFSPDLHEAEDLGTKGELPGVLDSFKFTDQ